MHMVCNMFEPNGRSLHQLTFGVFFTKSLKHNHKKIYDDDNEDEDEIFGVNTKLKDGCIYDGKDYRKRCLMQCYNVNSKVISLMMMMMMSKTIKYTSSFLCDL